MSLLDNLFLTFNYTTQLVYDCKFESTILEEQLHWNAEKFDISLDGCQPELPQQSSTEVFNLKKYSDSQKVYASTKWMWTNYADLLGIISKPPTY